MGPKDPRNPEMVAKHIQKRLSLHWESKQSCTKPKIVIIQGDPLTDRGISAITLRVAELLEAPRALIVLDEEIDKSHSPNADRKNVVLEYKYSQMASALEETTISKLHERIDNLLEEKNRKRSEQLQKPPLFDYYQDFARLQEVTKAACHAICGDVTVVHTMGTIPEFSVTSFYEAGLDLGLIQRDQMVSYGKEDP